MPNRNVAYMSEYKKGLSMSDINSARLRPGRFGGCLRGWRDRDDSGALPWIDDGPAN